MPPFCVRKGKAAMNTPAKKQITVIAANNAAAFQREANRALAHINRPRLVFDRNRPYLLYIVYDENNERN